MSLALGDTGSLMHAFRLLLLLSVLLCCPGHAPAQSLAPRAAVPDVVGAPLQRRFLPEDYNAAPVHLAVTSDEYGRMVFGNIEGLLRYDGENWELIELPARAPVRSLAKARDGRIYVGSYDTFGWLEIDALGQTRYRELLTAAGLADSARHVGIVWEVLCTDEGVYFRTETALHFLDTRHQNPRSWPVPEDARSFYADGPRLYTRVQGLGFGRFDNGEFKLEPQGERFADTPLPDVVPMRDWRLLVADDGFYRSDSAGIARIHSGDGDLLRGAEAYSARRLADGSLVVGTRGGALLHFNANLTLRQRLELGRHSIEALGTDGEGGLWAATEGGLVRLSLPSPWSFLGPAHGLNGNIYDFEWFDGALWLAGSRGVARLQAGAASESAERKPWVDYEAYALHASAQGLLIGYRDGLLVLLPGASKPVALITNEDESVFGLLPSRYDPELLYALSSEHLHLLRRNGTHWRVAHSLPIAGLNPAGLEESAVGEIWLGNSRGGPRRWRIDTATGKRLDEQVFDETHGLDVDSDAGTTVYRLDDEIHAVSGERGYRFDGERFVADVAPPLTLVDRPAELTVSETPLGTYAYTSRQLWHRAPGEREWRAIYLNPDLAAGYGNLRVNQDGVLRVATWSGLLQYDPEQPQATLPPLSLRVENVMARPVDGSRDSFALPAGQLGDTVRVPPGHTISLKFSMVSMESGAQYRYFLHGVTPEWSGWTDRELFIRSLPAGDYVLDVQARTRSGREVPTLSFRFRTLPHWYEQWWARLLGGLLLASAAAGLTWAFVRRRTARFLAANRRLEARIAERTHELETANRQLAELATEDGLTGIANRRALELGLRREWQRCLDQRRTLSALMIDVDHFKKFNDEYGHLEGDHRLKAVAQHLRQMHDPQRELLARYGGEEFALLLPGVPLDEASRRGEVLRASLAESDLRLTVSIGVAGFVPDVQSEPDSLLRRADSALYRAKRGGRNRVEADTD